MARYWVGGTGTWDASSTHWSATSGGAAGASAPTSADDVFFNAASGAGTATIAAGAACRNLDCSGYSAAINFPSGASLDVYGSFKLTAAMTWTLGSSSALLTLRSAGAAQITLAGKTMGNTTFDGSGSWQLQDAVTTSTNRSFILTSGTLDLNAQTLHLGGQFSSSNANVRELKAAGATINLNASGTVWSTTTATNFIQTGFATLTVNVTNTAAAAKTIGHGGEKIGTVNVLPDAAPGNASGVVSFNTFAAGALNVSGPKYVGLNVAAKPVDRLALTGSPGNQVDARSTTPGTRAPVITATRCTSVYTTFTDIEARGPTLFCGVGCVNAANNAGMQFGLASGLLDVV